MKRLLGVVSALAVEALVLGAALLLPPYIELCRIQRDVREARQLLNQTDVRVSFMERAIEQKRNDLRR